MGIEVDDILSNATQKHTKYAIRDMSLTPNYQQDILKVVRPRRCSEDAWVNQARAIRFIVLQIFYFL